MQTSGPWSERQIRAHLEAAVLPLRLASNTASGHPLLLSLWFVPLEGALYCAALASSRVVGSLARDPRCSVEVAADQPPYRGIRGRGAARLEPARGEEILRLALRRYLGSDDGPLARWLLSRSAREVAIRISLDRIASFDYTARMAPAGEAAR
jgi:hypothetical protein